jgi:hypothetical protein
MYNNIPRAFENRMCGGDFANIRSFWSEMELCQNPMYLTHPVRDRFDHFDKAVPLSLHGDGCPVSGFGKSWLKIAEIYSWRSLLAQGASWMMNIMIFFMYVGIMATHEGTHTRDRFFRRLRWSLHWLQKGKWPTHDEFGTKYVLGTPEGDLAGTWLAAGYYAIMFVLRHDLDHGRVALQFPNANSDTPCGCCSANATTMPWQDFGARDLEPAWFLTMWITLGPEAWMSAHADKPALFYVAGLTGLLYIPDWMHCKNIGTDCEFFGSLLTYFVYHMGLGEPDAVLQTIWTKLRQFFWDFKPNTHFQEIKMGMFYKHNDFPRLKGRAAEVKSLGPALLQVFSQYADLTNNVQRWMLEALRLMLLEARVGNSAPRGG